jgi:hypothetical protein
MNNNPEKLQRIIEKAFEYYEGYIGKPNKAIVTTDVFWILKNAGLTEINESIEAIKGYTGYDLKGKNIRLYGTKNLPETASSRVEAICRRVEHPLFLCRSSWRLWEKGYSDIVGYDLDTEFQILIY